MGELDYNEELVKRYQDPLTRGLLSTFDQQRAQFMLDWKKKEEFVSRVNEKLDNDLRLKVEFLIEYFTLYGTIESLELKKYLVNKHFISLMWALDRCINEKSSKITAHQLALLLKLKNEFSNHKDLYYDSKLKDAVNQIPKIDFPTWLDVGSLEKVFQKKSMRKNGLYAMALGSFCAFGIPLLGLMTGFLKDGEALSPIFWTSIIIGVLIFFIGIIIVVSNEYKIENWPDKFEFTSENIEKAKKQIASYKDAQKKVSLVQTACLTEIEKSLDTENIDRIKLFEEYFKRAT